MITTDMNEILTELRKPFHPSDVTWKPGSVNKENTKALALAYGDLRAYQNRLDKVLGLNWSVTYSPWGSKLVCHLTIAGVTRSSTGEADKQSEKSEIAGTSAEAQAFKRACAMFGLGRYLYEFPSVWVEYDGKQFTDRANAKLEGIVAQHYRRTMTGQEEVSELFKNEPEEKPTAAAVVPLSDALKAQFQDLGKELYAEQWDQVNGHNVERITGGASTNFEDLTAEQIGKLIDGMKKLKLKRQALTAATNGAVHA